MEKITITPEKLGGSIKIPPSKSVSHRMVICAALAPGTSTIRNLLLSEDITATCQAMTALGAGITRVPEGNGRWTLIVTGTGEVHGGSQTIDCNESGSTLRFLAPLAALDARGVRLIGRGRLAERPMAPYLKIFDEQGIRWTCEEPGKALPLTLEGRLSAGRFELPGDVSSQFVTGLLLALPLLAGDSEIVMTSPMESRPYVDITLDVMKHFGVAVDNDGYTCFKIKGGQRYCPGNLRVEGDYSQAAFWMAAGVLGRGMDCLDLAADSAQGDRAIVDFIRKMGGDIESVDGGFRVRPSALKGITMDVSQCPDLVPILTVMAALAQGETHIVNAGRLRLKESDRLAAMADVLGTLGADITEEPEGLTVRGVPELTGGQVDSYNDHRVAMAVAVATMACRGPVVLERPDCVRKSYPDFWRDFEKMGGNIQ